VKFLIHSNGPNVKTGYGVQTKLLVDRLTADGHQVAVSATYGQTMGCGMGEYITPSGVKVPVYPSLFLVSGDDVVMAHAKHFFGADEGWIIPLLDVWSLANPGLADMNVAAWAPVDHDPVPKMVLDFFDRSKARCIAMTRHGQEQFTAAGLDAAYIPLSVDTKVYRPRYTATIDGREVNGREFLNLPEQAFVVGMVAMNKDPNRKGWSEGLQAFAKFRQKHPNAILHIHTEKSGTAGGVDLVALAAMCGIPLEAVRFTNQYAYAIGFPPELMALMFTAFDVLLAPSLGEGFCVPLVEAQACGVPVIATDFTAQPELVGAGWIVSGQKWWDGPSKSWYQTPNVDQIADALEESYNADFDELAEKAIRFAQQYDTDWVYDRYWRPYLKTLDTTPEATKPKMERVAVLVPAVNRPENVKRLVESFNATNDGTADLYYILDEDQAEQIAAVESFGVRWFKADRGTSYASKMNEGYSQTTHDFVFLAGDDVEFTFGWIQAARELSDRYDVIGTNDSEQGRVRNPNVASGKHADHFFVRRSYVEDEGSSLEGPGILCPEAYYHFFTDKEMIQLARARGVFTPCLASVVIHHHPGYDGREDLRAKDPTYMKAVEFSEMDEIAFKRRAGLIEQHRTVKKDIWS
jgi:glycosyltransferase involved in cell wall biosynthesis